MSATSRGRERSERDFYETPRWCVEQLLSVEPLAPPYFDPCCGNGAILDVLRMYGPTSGADIHVPSVTECEARGLSASVADYLSDVGWRYREGSVVMNPPYKHAAEFIRAALHERVIGTKIAVLLRLNFLGSSRKRLDLVGPKAPLRSVIVMSKRPSFTGDGRTDACDYAWMVWEVGYTGDTTMRVLPPAVPTRVDKGHQTSVRALSEIVDALEAYAEDWNSERPTDPTVLLPMLRDALRASSTDA